ncbi:hypothetical protein S7711_10640 [Stachybotrys chartarum IBT 7711]|uniref:Uncharacterized protein n=1 Tax=Stachybotrys chartarum (strain CBS 109288 / IBT 7711) TaxID=1280523 RepID=A0A084B2A1_STACB|nr:hypothetical protein S7711_10640 [Stachybotrys chartarum IBT 7711]KFA56031.1 hypothetical protein S40293_10753 [Stachybotrys chartarum IBT 40293]
MSQLTCVGFIANLEGWKKIDLPTDAEATYTLAHIDKRIRRLESSTSLTPPPPLLDPTWDSVAWRLCRLRRRCHLTPAPKNLDFAAITSLTPEPVKLSLEKVQTIIYGIPYRNGPQHFPGPIVDDDDKQAFNSLVQRLCHIAGHRSLKVMNIPTTLPELYTLAVEVSIEMENSPYPLGPPMPVSFPGSRPGRPGYANRKSCCGCCDCSCHRSSDTESITTRSETIVETEPFLKRLFRFGWVKRLACWSRKSDVRDDSSSSSGSIHLA